MGPSGPLSGEPATPTWRTELDSARRRLGSDLEARHMLARASGFDRAELVRHFDDPVPARAVDFLSSMVERRLEGEPLQYVLGVWGFRQLDLFVDRRVLIPRPETEAVVEVALGELRRLGPRRAPVLVDLGTGSGAIALSLASEVDGARVVKAQQDRQSAELSGARRGQIGGGGRSEKIRTYNFKESRVSDHRIGRNFNLERILDGDLDELVDALVGDERARQLQNG